MMSAIKRKGLGRGLDALLGANEDVAQSEGGVRDLPVGQLQAGKYQPRTRMDEGSLNELAESIRQQGVIQPILVRPVGDALYEIIAGERRYRAAKIAGLSSVPVVVREVPDESALVIALIENIQRENLSALEEALGVRRLIDEFGLTHEHAAQALGRSRSATSNLLRLLNLSAPVQELLMAGDLEMGHARALLALDAANQIMAAQRVVQNRLSVRETEKLVQSALRPALEKQSATKNHASPDRDVLSLQDRISDELGLTVVMNAKAGGAGEIRVRYTSLDQLDGFLQRLGISMAM